MGDADLALKLRLTEIFLSIQGESSRVGLPTVFVRLTGCPLRCSWCDTAYAFSGGESRSIEEILTTVLRYSVSHVCVTGGEPLAQKACVPMLGALCDAGLLVSLETSGALDISGVDHRVSRIMDLKTPSSGEASRNYWPNLDDLSPHDELKIVIAGAEDYRWAKARIDEYELLDRCTVLLSPEHGSLAPAKLAEWILRDRLAVRFQLQLHKVLWGNQPGR